MKTPEEVAEAYIVVHERGLYRHAIYLRNQIIDEDRHIEKVGASARILRRELAAIIAADREDQSARIAELEKLVREAMPIMSFASRWLAAAREAVGKGAK